MADLNERGAREVLASMIEIHNRIVRRRDKLRERADEIETELQDAYHMLSLAEVQINNLRQLIAEFDKARQTQGPLS